MLDLLPARARRAAASRAARAPRASRHDADRRDHGPHGRARGVVGARRRAACRSAWARASAWRCVDRARGIAGLAHVVLPEAERRGGGPAGKFADRAVPAARRPRSSALGARARRLEAVLVGGAQHVRRSASAARSTSAQRNEAAVRAAARARAHPGGRRRRPAAPRPHDPRRVGSGARDRRSEAGGAEHRAATRLRPEVRGMSGRSLSPDAIAALVDAAKRGPAARGRRARRRSGAAAAAHGRLHAPDEVHHRPGAPARAARWRAFCRTASTRLSAELRVPLELEVIDVHAADLVQRPRAGARRTRSARDHRRRADRHADAADRRAARSCSARSSCCSAASGRRAPRERRLTDIDWALVAPLLRHACSAQLSLIWTDVAELELGARRARHARSRPRRWPRCQRADARRSPIEARIDASLVDASSLLRPVSRDRAGRRPASRAATDARRGRRGRGPREAVDAALRGVEMTVRAEVADTSSMPIEEVLALQARRRPAPRRPAPSRGITLFADQVPVHRGPPGPQRRRRAVQITRPPWRTADERRRGPDPPGRVHLRGRRRRARDVRRRRGSAPARSRSSRPRPTRSPASRRPPSPTSVSYVDGVTGGNVFVMTLDGRAHASPPR